MAKALQTDSAGHCSCNHDKKRFWISSFQGWLIYVIKFNIQQDRQYKYNVIFKSVRVGIFAVGKQ